MRIPMLASVDQKDDCIEGVEPDAAELQDTWQW